MKDAIKITPEGVILDLEISAGAKETAIQGYNEWRKRIEVRIAHRAQKGKANHELISFSVSQGSLPVFSAISLRISYCLSNPKLSLCFLNLH